MKSVRQQFDKWTVDHTVNDIDGNEAFVRD